MVCSGPPLQGADQAANCRGDRDKLINAFDLDWSGAVPYTVIISPEGKIIYREVDRIDPLAVKRAIVKALNERKPW